MVFADSGVAIAYACVYSFVCKACWVFAAVLQSVCAFGFRWNQIHINSNNGDCRSPCFKILGSDPPQMLVFVCMLSKMLLWLAVKTVRFKTPSGLEGQRQQRCAGQCWSFAEKRVIQIHPTQQTAARFYLRECQHQSSSPLTQAGDLAIEKSVPGFKAVTFPGLFWLLAQWAFFD